MLTSSCCVFSCFKQGMLKIILYLQLWISYYALPIHIFESIQFYLCLSNFLLLGGVQEGKFKGCQQVFMLSRR